MEDVHATIEDAAAGAVPPKKGLMLPICYSYLQTSSSACAESRLSSSLFRAEVDWSQAPPLKGHGAGDERYLDRGGGIAFVRLVPRPY